MKVMVYINSNIIKFSGILTEAESFEEAKTKVKNILTDMGYNEKDYKIVSAETEEEFCSFGK